MNRRLALLRATKLIALAGLLLAAYPFLSTLVPDDAIHAERQRQWQREIDASALRPGEILTVDDWPGGPVAIYRRTASELRDLRANEEHLQDARSEHGRQPADVDRLTRSHLREYFVFVPLDTERGCAVQYRSANQPPKPGLTWNGGFAERCADSLYDTAGRVYRGHRSARQQNLPVPAYRPLGKARFELLAPPPAR